MLLYWVSQHNSKLALILRLSALAVVMVLLSAVLEDAPYDMRVGVGILLAGDMLLTWYREYLDGRRAKQDTASHEPVADGDHPSDR